MSGEPAEIIKNTRERHQGLKEALKTRDPGSREVELQRKDLRRLYLQLLLVHPYSKEAKDVETHLWMQTSYAFISRYKQRVAELDRVVHPDPHQPPPSDHTSHGPVEYRKLLGRFRQFLAEEEKFWTQLVVRLRRTFVLDDAQAALVALGIAPDEEPEPKDDTGGRGRPASEFPSSTDATVHPPSTIAERESRVSILGKALVCLGDIARYREQYNEGGGRPRAGKEDGPPAMPPKRNGRMRRGGGSMPDVSQIPKERNYERAQRFYEQARLLVPAEGNASHQLAILASYKRDVFGSLVHYYRALCAKHPYETASDNMASALGKALDNWKASKRREGRGPRGAAQTPKMRVDTVKEDIVILHARWRSGPHRNPQLLSNYSSAVVTQYQSLVSERLLPIATIADVIVLAQGALWKHRMVRDRRASAPSSSATTLEHAVLSHLLAIHRSLWEVGLSEVAEGLAEGASEQEPAQKITATFRRTLPALRIATKWLRAHSKYLVQVGTREGGQQESDEDNTRRNDIGAVLRTFWETFAQFSTALARSFPPDTLPKLVTPLQEDISMRGFLPLRRLMIGEAKTATPSSDNGALSPTTGQQPGVHPNEEQLMRIADLLQDSHEVVQVENIPVVFREGKFVMKTSAEVWRQTDVIKVDEDAEVEDDVLTDAPTEDDPVRDAFRTTLEDVGVEPLEEEEDEIVVWDPRVPTSPIKQPSHIEPSISPPVMGSPQSPPHSLVSSTVPSPPTRGPVDALPKTGTTAADLLNTFMKAPRSFAAAGDLSRPVLPPSASVLPPPLHASHTSIWSTSFDAGPPTFQADASMPRMSMSPPRQDASQTSWLSPQGGASQEMHFAAQIMPGGVPMGPIARPFAGELPGAPPPSRLPDMLPYQRYDQSAVLRNGEFSGAHGESYGVTPHASGPFGDLRYTDPAYHGHNYASSATTAYRDVNYADPAIVHSNSPMDAYSPARRGLQSYLPHPVSYYPAQAR